MARSTSAGRLSNLEMHVVHACNLACESCSHYSNQGHSGQLTLDEADRWMRLWRDRLLPQTFSLLGGEPAIHPQLPELVYLARQHWPAAHLRLVTNGLLLHQQAQLPRALAEVGNARLTLSIHHHSDPYRRRLAPTLELLEEWVRVYGIAVKMTDAFAYWRYQYRGYGAAMSPFHDENPRSSWEHCKGRDCKQLHEGKIWKCAPLAYLGQQHRTHGLSEEWAPYLRYEALGADCSDEALARFLGCEEESFCAMCPAVPEHFEKPLPLRAG